MTAEAGAKDSRRGRRRRVRDRNAECGARLRSAMPRRVADRAKQPARLAPRPERLPNAVVSQKTALDNARRETLKFTAREDALPPPGDG